MTRKRAVAAVALCAALAGMACGKKGSPLAPFVRVPAPISTTTATRLGNEVFVTVAIPAGNVDGSLPADLVRVDIYSYTGITPPPRERFTTLGTLVASVPVAPGQVLPRPGEPPPPPLVPSLDPRPGGTATIRDQLTAEDFVQGPVDVDPRRAAAPAAIAVTTTPVPQVLRRFYLAIGVNTRGVPGTPSTPTDMPLITPPDPPQRLMASYTETVLTLTWDPPGGLLGFILDRPIPAEALPFDVFGPQPAPVPNGSVPPGPTTFNVYRDLAPDPLALPPLALPSWSAALPTPLNPAAGLSLTQPVEFGRFRCYRVRAIRGAAPASEPSEPLCFTPFDVFPPVAPVGLTALASDTGISLLWEPNNEVDLGGYLVLRRASGDATLRLLTDRPIPDTRFVDTTATSGTRYIYSVVAVDNRLPLPNLSAESVPQEETAR